jgi:hypothetical protein
MPVDHILVEAIVRGEIKSAPEPPGRMGALGVGEEEAHVGVTGGDVGISGMDDQGHPQSLPRFAGELRAVSRGGGRELRPAYVRKRDPGFFKHRAVGQEAGPPASALGSSPHIFLESGARFFRLQREADAILQSTEVRFNGG